MSAPDGKAGTTDNDTRAEPAWFGDRPVDAAEKPGLVRGVFDSVAGRYDLMNDLMSGGVHRLWKRAMIDRLAPKQGEIFLDVAGGTGDIAFRILERTERAAHVTVCDLTPAMLEVGRDRAIDRGILTAIDWVTGDAENLPFENAAMDGCTIAFGLRNVTHPERALAEMHRVLKPGGRFLCLEFSHVVLPGLRDLYDVFSRSMLPTLGAGGARDRASYEYLVESIRRFPTQEALAAMMRDAGFDLVSFRNLSAGIAALHVGWRT
ncbi:MAG: bifunctional demethylmenaquinone methyltransferase/2-methoxy-6-polyprenyl-1,4-benzoquinol methylase UbiE [Dongiaceae bacterium]